MATTQKLPWRRSNVKVLIVDDSPDALAVAKARLTKENLDVICADGGKAGIESAKSAKPDLILLDVDMPDMSGFDVCRILKSDSEMKSIPIIFLSASHETRDKIKGLDLGAVDYVTKPFDAFELRARVRAALRTKRLQDLLVKQSQIDPLTELSNRGALAKRMVREWARKERHGNALSFIMCDLDHFKRINDEHGHGVGDKVLCQVARAITSCCRKTDFPARYGGEEFAIVVSDEYAEKAKSLADRCRQEIEGIRLSVEGNMVQATASFGVADTRGATSAEDLIKKADEAMYRAKDGGRNRVELARYLQGASKPGLAF